MREHSMIPNSAALVLILFSLHSTRLFAQTCMGGASFARHRVQIGGGYSTGSGTQSTAAEASLGARIGPFLSIGGGVAHVDNSVKDPTFVSVTGAMGTGPLGPLETELCPFISLAVANGLELPFGETTWLRSYGAGVGIGSRVNSGTQFEVVPFASAALVLPTTSVVDVGSEFPLGWTDENYLAASIGVGFVIGQVLTVRPSMNLATHGRTTSSLGLRVSYAFGRAALPPSPPRPADGSLATVWVNPRAMVYYCSGSQSYGNTAGGEFMTERDALAAGYTPDGGKRC